MLNSGINYLVLIKKAAGITWRNRYLWWFGLLIALSSASSGFFQVWPRKKDIQGQNIADLITGNRELIIFALVGFFLLLILFGILGIFAKGGLIKSLNAIVESQPASFRSGLKKGRKYFWKIFLIGIFSTIFILAILIVFMIPIGFLFYNKAYFLGGLLSFLALVIFIPVVFLVSFVKIYGYFYVILSDLPLGESLENAYALLKKNIVPSIILCLVFLIISSLVTVSALLFVIPFLIIFFMIGALLFFLAKQIGIIIAVILGSLFILAVMIFGGSVYQVFTHAMLVLFFREIATPKIKEEVEAEKVVELGPARASDSVAGN